MSFIGVSLAVLAGGGCAGAGYLLHKKSHIAPSRELEWFHLVPVPRALWGAATSTSFDKQRLFDGLGLSEEDPRPRMLQATLSSRHADLPSQSQEATLIGVPSSAAESMRFAAAGCDVMAIPTAAPRDNQQVIDIPELVTARPAPAWKLGLSAQGTPVALHAVPGATIVVVGSAHAIDNLLHGMRWPEALATVLRAHAHTRDAVTEWKAQWHPSRTRLLVRECGTEQLAGFEAHHRPTATAVCERLVPGIHADLVVVLPGSDHSGLLIHRDYRQAFTPFGYRPNTASSLGSSLPRSSSPERTARVASALAASSSSAG